MLRVTVGAAILAALISTYLANPVVGWFALGTLFMFALIRRSRRVAAPASGADAREAVRALHKDSGIKRLIA